LHERGLDQDVAVVIWGEMGRTPRVGTQRGTVGGRDHWPQSGFALMAGGGLRVGQVVGATDPRGENPRGRAYTPQNVLATLYHVLASIRRRRSTTTRDVRSTCSTTATRWRSWCEALTTESQSTQRVA